MTTYYIIDTTLNAIVNAVETTSTERAQGVVAGMIDAHNLRVSANPPLAMLEAYQFWNERP
jgi:hypothetical protein